MTVFDIFNKFGELFPQFRQELNIWVPVNESTVEVTLYNGQVLIFTYFTDKKWSLNAYE